MIDVHNSYKTRKDGFPGLAFGGEHMRDFDLLPVPEDGGLL